MIKGRTRGLEPPNGGTTNHCLNHLATLAIFFTSFMIAPLLGDYAIFLEYLTATELAMDGAGITKQSVNSVNRLENSIKHNRILMGLRRH